MGLKSHASSPLCESISSVRIAWKRTWKCCLDWLINTNGSRIKQSRMRWWRKRTGRIWFARFVPWFLIESVMIVIVLIFNRDVTGSRILRVHDQLQWSEDGEIPRNEGSGGQEKEQGWKEEIEIKIHEINVAVFAFFQSFMVTNETRNRFFGVHVFIDFFITDSKVTEFGVFFEELQNSRNSPNIRQGSSL